MKKKTKELISNALWMIAISLIGTGFLLCSLIK